jgi:hypothetical protein
MSGGQEMQRRDNGGWKDGLREIRIPCEEIGSVVGRFFLDLPLTMNLTCLSTNKGRSMNMDSFQDKTISEQSWNCYRRPDISEQSAYESSRPADLRFLRPLEQ